MSITEFIEFLDALSGQSTRLADTLATDHSAVEPLLEEFRREFQSGYSEALSSSRLVEKVPRLPEVLDDLRQAHDAQLDCYWEAAQKEGKSVVPLMA
jgi:hypothetical protein